MHESWETWENCRTWYLWYQFKGTVSVILFDLPCNDGTYLQSFVLSIGVQSVQKYNKIVVLHFYGVHYSSFLYIQWIYVHFTHLNTLLDYSNKLEFAVKTLFKNLPVFA